MSSDLLDERQVWFLDDLITFMIEYYDISNRADYGLFKAKIEEWQQYGFYDDAMLYFWYYEPIQYLNDIKRDIYLNFCKVIHNLGFYIPTDEQVVICNTLYLIEQIEQVKSLDERKDKIHDLWMAWDYGETYDTTHIIKAFNILRNQDILDSDGKNDLFEKCYRKLLKLFKLWKARYPSKEQIYLSLII